jgi:hypothetical protein
MTPPVEPARASQLLVWWCWGVCGFLIIVGAIGFFTNDIGPLPTNRVHALALNLSVGLGGFGFARFGRESAFVLLVGIGMIVMATLGFLPATQTWLYTTLHMNTAESVIELVGGVISLGLWGAARRATRAA